MSKRLIALSVGVLGVVLAAAGCGGDDEEASTSSITKAEFIRKADAICKKGDRQVEEKFAAFLKENEELLKTSDVSEAELAAGSAEVAETILIPGARKEMETLRALEAPSGDEDQIEEILDALDESIERSEEDPQAAVMSNLEVFRRPKGLAEEYGLKVCGL